MMRNRRYNFRGNQDAITLSHLVTMMSALPQGSSQFLMGVTDPNQLWTMGAYIQQGFRMHGDSVPSWAAAALTDPTKNDVGGVLQRYWNAINSWAVIWPHSTNTTTNAFVSIFDAQLYVLSSSTGKWTRVDSGNGSMPFVFPYYDMTTAAWQQAGSFFNDPLYSRYATATVRNAANRGAAATIPGDESKFSYAHNAIIPFLTVDGSDVAGVFATCKARMFTIDGAAFNGTTKIMMDIGVDFKPETSTALNAGEFAGLTYYPGSGGSDWIQLPTDGSIQRLSYCTVGGSGFSVRLDNSNDGTWSANNRVYLTYDEIAAKLPVLRFNAAA